MISFYDTGRKKRDMCYIIDGSRGPYTLLLLRVYPL